MPSVTDTPGRLPLLTTQQRQAVKARTDAVMAYRRSGCIDIESYEDIADEFGVSRQVVQRIASGFQYKRVNRLDQK